MLRRNKKTRTSSTSRTSRKRSASPSQKRSISSVSLKGPSRTVSHSHTRPSGRRAITTTTSSRTTRKSSSSATKRNLRSQFSETRIRLFSVTASESVPKVVPTTKLFVDDQPIEVPSSFTLFQACEAAGKAIPRFCYQERLAIAGNCRMCLVEVERVPKPVASCAYPLMPNMRVKTNSPMVKKAREGVLEFILENHPLDCPICDEGGECDLQDQSREFGSDRSRFREVKRAVEDKYIGPVVKTIMTRCINCTRCVRFADEIAGVETLGVTGRGMHAEIGTYIQKNFDSELSGNIVDLCPVGALTNRAYAFKARPWELENTHSIDVMDAVGTNIRVDSRGTEVLRALPRENDAINEEWVSDKGRMAVDGLNHQRIDQPLVRDRQTGQLSAVTWTDALAAIKRGMYGLRGEDVQAIAGDLADAESIMALKDLTNALGSSNTTFSDGIDISADIRSHYLFNTRIANLDSSDCIILVGTNPRMEAPIINARIRKQTFSRGIPVFGIGPEADLALPTQWMGNDASELEAILSGDDKSKLVRTLNAAKRPVIIFGIGAFTNENGNQMLNTMEAMAEKYPSLWNDEWKGINVLHSSAARVAALDLGFTKGPDVDSTKTPSAVFLLNADSEHVNKLMTSSEFQQKQPFVVYQGSHGDMGAELADVVLPSTAYTEKRATYVNTEGRTQSTNKAVVGKNVAQDDWKIIRAMSEVLGVQLPYSDVGSLRQRISFVAPHLQFEDEITPTSVQLNHAKSKKPVLSKNAIMQPFLTNHFFTNSITRASPVMAKLSKELPVSRNSYVKKLQTVSVNKM